MVEIGKGVKMGNVYDQEQTLQAIKQTDIQQKTLKEIKQNTVLTKWILGLTVVVIILSILSLVMFSKRG